MKNLTRVNGIGVFEALLLRRAGINTIEQLANYQIEDLAKIEEITIDLAKKWIFAAYNLIYKETPPKTSLGISITSQYDLKTTSQRECEESKKDIKKK